MITLTLSKAEFRALAMLLETGARALQAGRKDPFLELALENLNARLAEAQQPEE